MFELFSYLTKKIRAPINSENEQNHSEGVVKANYAREALSYHPPKKRVDQQN